MVGELELGMGRVGSRDLQGACLGLAVSSIYRRRALRGSSPGTAALGSWLSHRARPQPLRSLPVHRQPAAGVAEAPSGRAESGPAQPRRPPGPGGSAEQWVREHPLPWLPCRGQRRAPQARPWQIRGPPEEVGWATVSPHRGHPLSLGFPGASPVGDVPRPCAPECHPTPTPPGPGGGGGGSEW